MAIVYCAAVDCKHRNENNRCTLKKICLNEGRVHTKHQGFKQVWECKNYEQSERSKEIEEMVKWLMGVDGDGRG